MSKTYLHDKSHHPLIEAEYDTAFKVYKSDRKRAVISDPEECIEAKGLKRMPNVAFAHIGSGKDAYVGFKDDESPTGITVRHFIILAAAAKVRDLFDVKGSPETQILMLNAPTPGRTLSRRSILGKTRRTAIKNGAAIKTRGSNKKPRIIRLGVPHRPRAKITKGEVSLVD